MFPPWISRSIVSAVIVSSFIFFTFALVFEPKQGPIWLHIRGPKGSKEIITAICDSLLDPRQAAMRIPTIRRTRPPILAATASPIVGQARRTWCKSIRIPLCIPGWACQAYTDNGATSHYVRCSCGLLNHERSPDGKKYYYLFDGLGSIVGMTDSGGNEVNRYDYDPYGVMLNQQEQTGFTNLFKFAGGQYRSSTGLYKFGERYYDPSLGRWTQLDSAGTGYVYANDNPVNEVDPSGKYSNYVALNCGIAAIDVEPSGFSGLFDMLLTLTSSWGPILSVWGSFIWMGSLISSVLPLPGFGNGSSFYEAEAVNLPAGFGTVAGGASGFALTPQGVCSFNIYSWTTL